MLVPYDLGSYQDEYSLITILTMTASVALIIPATLAQPSYWVVVAGIWVIGQFIGINDDYIGHKDHFQVAVQSAANNPGVEQTWSDNDFEIKLKVE